MLCSVSFSTCLFCGLRLGIYPLWPLFFLSGQWDCNCFSHRCSPWVSFCNRDYGNNKACRTSSYWRPADAGRCWPIPSTSARRQHTEAPSCEQSGSFWGRRKWVETAVRMYRLFESPPYLRGMWFILDICETGWVPHIHILLLCITLS